MAPTKKTRRRPTAADQLRTKLKAAADEINHHETRALQQSREIDIWHQKTVEAEETLAKFQRRPAAYNTRIQRHVPLCYWSNPDLLELLHTIESHAMGQRATPAPRSGELRYDRIGFPDPLYRHVCEEAAERGLVQRHDSPNGAEPETLRREPR